MRYGIVYVVTNNVNGMRYVGQTSQPLKERWKQHLKRSGATGLFQRALAKYGAAAFSVEEVANASSRDELNALERHFIHVMGTLSPGGYNLNDGGGASGRLADSLKDRIRRTTNSPEVRAKLSAAQKKRFENPEERAKISEDNRRRAADPSYRAQLSDRARAVMNDPAAREHIALKVQKLWEDPEYRSRMMESRSTDAHKQAKSASIKASHSRIEVKAKMASKSKAAWQDPAYRARLEALHADPEWQARRAIAIREGKARAKAKREAAASQHKT